MLTSSVPAELGPELVVVLESDLVVPNIALTDWTKTGLGAELVDRTTVCAMDWELELG
jgi:hypothetical protein